MAKGIFVLLIGLLLATALELGFAEEVKLASGEVLSHPAKGLQNEKGIVLSGTFYEWSALDPESARKLRADAQSKADAEAKAKRVGAPVRLRVKVSQVLDNGVLCFVLEGHTEELKYETVFVRCKPIEALHDGRTLVLDLYRCGRYRYTSVLGAGKTVARFATSVADADYVLRNE